MTQAIERSHGNARMSKIVRHGGLIYLCGQTAMGSAAAEISAQTTEVLSRIDSLLAEAGSDRTRLLSVLIHLSSLDDFAEMNKVWESWVPEGCAPARTTVEARLASSFLLVEMTVVAAEA
ncbi:MAG: RidA family protein [Azoarcus sp.]|jgi:enamine deaminase RidA (YjgF/YER057c/UK114 family)|nr:RidA family protein [Azoarcus sp.]MDD2874355.1 RidA family protein [Azoarcus sp.]